MKIIQKKGLVRHYEHCYRPYMCEGKHSLTGETYSTAEVSVHQVNVITYNTTSRPSVAITLKGLAGLEKRTTKFSLSRMYFHSSLMLKVCRLLSISFYELNTKIQLKTSPLMCCVLQSCQYLRNSLQSWGPTTTRCNIQPKHAWQQKSHVYIYFPWNGLHSVAALENISEFVRNKSPREAVPVYASFKATLSSLVRRRFFSSCLNRWSWQSESRWEKRERECRLV